MDGKIYIGKHQTLNLNDGYLGSGLKLQRAIKKHGVENFTKEILFIFETEVEMNEMEAELVTEEFCLREDGYNMCPGGKGGWGYVNNLEPILRNGFEHRPEDQKKWSELGKASMILKLKTDSDFSMLFRQAVSSGLKKKYSIETHPSVGKTHTAETKAKIGKSNSIAQSGTRNSQYGLQWITNGIESTRIKKDDPIPEGWKKGRKV